MTKLRTLLDITTFNTLFDVIRKPDDPAGTVSSGICLFLGYVRIVMSFFFVPAYLTINRGTMKTDQFGNPIL